MCSIHLTSISTCLSKPLIQNLQIKKNFLQIEIKMKLDVLTAGIFVGDGSRRRYGREHDGEGGQRQLLVDLQAVQARVQAPRVRRQAVRRPQPRLQRAPQEPHRRLQLPHLFEVHLQPFAC